MSKMAVRFLVMAAICALCLQPPTAEAATGNAVYYKPPYTPSACYKGEDHGKYVTGVKGWLWKDGQACGQKYRVRCVGASYNIPNPCTSGQEIEVTVVDFCKETCNGDLNLSQDAFAAIANLKAGNIKIEYSPA